jgi:hypothetical protein
MDLQLSIVCLVELPLRVSRLRVNRLLVGHRCLRALFTSLLRTVHLVSILPLLLKNYIADS